MVLTKKSKIYQLHVYITQIKFDVHIIYDYQNYNKIKF